MQTFKCSYDSQQALVETIEALDAPIAAMIFRSRHADAPEQGVVVIGADGETRRFRAENMRRLLNRRFKSAETSIQTDPSDRRILPAFILWLFLGGVGAHRFYLRLHGSAATQLVLALLGSADFFGFESSFSVICLVTVGIWLTIDMVRLVTGSMTDGDGLSVKAWT